MILLLGFYEITMGLKQDFYDISRGFLLEFSRVSMKFLWNFYGGMGFLLDSCENSMLFL